jgi:uncharacterized protein
LKNLFTLSFLFFLFSSESCISQDTTSKNPRTTFHISKERSDSLSIHIPRPKGFINDYTHLFTENEIQVLDSLVRVYEKMTTIEIVVATVDSSLVKDADFEDWGIGKKEKNNGILIVISPDLRRMRIENGYGIAKFFSDAETKQIIDNFFIPKFKEAKYFQGTYHGIIAITDQLKKNGL